MDGPGTARWWFPGANRAIRSELHPQALLSHRSGRHDEGACGARSRAGFGGQGGPAATKETSPSSSALTTSAKTRVKPVKPGAAIQFSVSTICAGARRFVRPDAGSGHPPSGPRDVFYGRQLYSHSRAVGFHHLANQGLKAGSRRPAQLRSGFGGVPLQELNLRRAVELRIGYHVIAVIEAGETEGQLGEFPHRMRLPRGHYVVVGLFLLQHAPHGFYVIGGMAPVPLGVHVAHAQIPGFPGPNLGHRGGNLAGHKLEAAARGLVIEQDAAGGMQTIGFTIVTGEVEAGYLANAVRRTQIGRASCRVRG